MQPGLTSICHSSPRSLEDGICALRRMQCPVSNVFHPLINSSNNSLTVRINNSIMLGEHAMLSIGLMLTVLNADYTRHCTLFYTSINAYAWHSMLLCHKPVMMTVIDRIDASITPLSRQLLINASIIIIFNRGEHNRYDNGI